MIVMIGMMLPMQQQGMSSFDWSRLVEPTLILLIIGWLAAVMRPLLARLLYWIAETEQGRSADFVFKGLEAPGAADRFRRYAEAAHADRIAEVDEAMRDASERAEEAMRIAKANSDRLEGLDASMTAHGAELIKINEKVADIPRLSDTLDRLQTTMEKVSDHMQRANEFMIRADERDRSERRHAQLPNSPLRRAGDHPDDQSEGR
jgi:hypothetical protein